MALCAGLVGDRTNQQKYEKLATTLKAKLETTFWNASKQALVHNSINGVQSDAVTRYANMFSVFFNYLTPEKQQAIKHSVLLNDSILKITTPYMRFYELEALCALGEQETVMQEMKAYWGGMLKEGATSFWENIIRRKAVRSISPCMVVLMGRVCVMLGEQVLFICSANITWE